jgi:hypothetical protein
MSETDRRLTSALIARLAEIDARKLYASEMGFPSMFDYCVKTLRYGEGSAYKRIRIARLARDFPIVLEMITVGDVTLAGLTVLAPHLTRENHKELLNFARRKSMRELERYVASMAPRPDLADCVRRLPVVEVVESQLRMASPPPAVMARKSSLESVESLAPQRVHFGFTGSEELRGKLDRAKEILRHKFPFGRIEDIVEFALERLLESYDPDRKSPARKPDTARQDMTRAIPQWVKDEVWRRDAGRCSFATKEGGACGARGWLEYDHVKPWALGGASNDPGNVRLLCRAHNQVSARAAFGPSLPFFQPSKR